MAPEVLESKNYGNKCDIWSLGCVWYELISGTKPFGGASIPQTMKNIIEGKFEPLTAELMHKFAKMCTKMLQLDPELRPSVEEVCKEFIEEITKLNQNVDDGTVTLKSRYKYHPQHDLIGRGSYGSSFKVVDTQTNKILVMKQVSISRAHKSLEKVIIEA